MRAERELDHEVKYVLPAEMVPAARALVAGVARPEQPHAASLVESIYFDDPRLGSLAEKEASEYLKTKLRLRWYDGGGPVFLELKRRRGSRREKRRTALPLTGEELSRRGLGGVARLGLERYSAALGAPIAAEQRPLLRLRYRRERYVAPGGARLCLDWEITALEGAPELGTGGGPAVLRAAVFELKAPGRALPPTLEALALLGARRRSFSKLAACVARLSET